MVTEKQRRLLDGVGLTVAEEGITVEWASRLEQGDYVKEFAMKVMKEGGIGELTRMVPRME